MSVSFRESQKCPFLVLIFIGYYGYCFIKFVNGIVFYWDLKRLNVPNFFVPQFKLASNPRNTVSKIGAF